MYRKLKRFTSLLLVLTLCFSVVAIPAQASTVDHVVISQVYGGGGNSGATYKNDFIELYNPTDSAISLEGWSVQYGSSSGTTYTNITALSGSIGANSYYLIQEAAGTGGTTDLPTPEATGSIAMSGTNGKVALVSNTEAISGKSDADVVDFVGFGSANEYEGTGATPALSSTKAAIRIDPNVDTDDNSADFQTSAPNPRNGGPSEPTQCAAPSADYASGAVTAGTLVTFSSTTEGASIEYNTTAADAADGTWTAANTATVTADTTYYVRAVKDGLTASDVATFTYTVMTTDGVASIADVKAEAANTPNLKIQGVITYISGKNVYVQDETGAICLYLNASASALQVGDEIIAVGTRKDYNNLIELSGINEADIAVLSHDNTAPDLGTATVAELIDTPDGKTAGYDHMCETIGVEGATLTSTTLLSQDGSELTIYPAADLTKYPGVSVGDTVDVTLRMSDYNGTLQAAVISMSLPAGTLVVSASPAGGTVNDNTAVTLSCNASGATIYYTTDSTEPTTMSSDVYSVPIAITGGVGDTVTVKALAVKDANTSPVATFSYTIKDPAAALTIKDVLGLPDNTTNVTVSGQITYFATSYSNPVLQAVVGGQTYSLYVFGSVPDGAKVGDVIEMTGTFSLYNGLPELSSITDSWITDSTATPMAAETHTISEIKANGANMLGRFVKIQNVTLGTYNASGSTQISDATGSINIYKATAYPVCVEQGDVVDLYAMVACYNSTIQLYTGTADANGFAVYDVVNDTKAPVITLPDSFLDAKAGQDYLISLDAADNKGLAAVTLTYTINGVSKTDLAMVRNSESGKYEYTIPGTEITGAATDIKFTVTATDVSSLTAQTPETTIAINDKPQITAVTPARNSATGDNKTPEISVTLDNAGDAPTVTLTLKQGDTTVVSEQAMALKSGETAVYTYTPSQLADGKYTATVTVTRVSDGKSATESWSFHVGTPQYTAYFGQLHAHTAEYSDGSGTLTNGLDYVAALPESENVDFEAFTDHSNYFDTTGAPNPAEALNDESKMTAASRATWDTYRSTMESFNEQHAGSLVALPGFEMTWSGGPGHINTFNSDGLVSRNNDPLNDKTSDAGMKLYYDTLIANPDPLANLSQFNHPGKTFGTFNDFAYWSPAYDNKMVAVEVGNGEGAIGSGGYFPSYEDYTMALDKGWHVAPTNNQDNHKGHWGNSNTARTVIITDDLSTEGLLQGLKDMSVYATEDKNLNISYTLNDQRMGSIISDVPTEPLKFALNIDDPDSTDVISKVEIITNGGRVASSKTFTSNSADWSFELPAAKGYYYVRVTQADKNIAVTAPVWIGQAAVMGISSLECDTKMPVTGEAVTLTATLFNNEESAATLKSITYSQGGKTLASETPGTELSAMGTLKHTCSFTPDAAGTATVTVTAVLTLDGEDKEFTADAVLNVRDSDKLVYVGIDASHYNEYVDGNYKDSMGNFANLAVDYDIRVVELDTGAELIAAANNPKFRMLVLTPPTRRNGNYFLSGYQSYSDDEISAIAAFAKAGGTVIVTGWGDYYESYSAYDDTAHTPHTLPAEEQMSAQQNKLLAAIGATLRVSDDEIKDDTQNGGQAQRLYLTNCNMENPFLAGVQQDKQVYSNYGGSTVYAVDENQQPDGALPASVSPMVYAFDTSYSSDDDHDGTTGISGVAVPQYDGKYLVAASETVSHDNGTASTVIVAGSAFMSNFEIQATLDNYGTPEYSNYTILQNVLSAVNPVAIADIADVQAAEEGQAFTIRGIATSNSSGYDKDTAFFDCIYVQDATGGINAFPVAENIQAGQTVEIKGTTSSYNGERQIAVTKVTVINDAVQALPSPVTETTAQAASGGHLGSLVSVKGTITRFTSPSGVVESIYVKDASGTECRVFIDGYITSKKTIPNLAVGASLTATGLSSIDTEGARIRIRDRADVVCTAQGDTSPDSGDSGNSSAPSGITTVRDGNRSTVSAAVTGSLQSSSGSMQANVTKATVQSQISAAQKAEASGQSALIEWKVESAGQADTLQVTVPKESFREIASATDAEVKVSSALGSVKLNAEAVKNISDAASGGDLSIHISKVNPETLSPENQKLVGNRPVYSYAITAGGTTISDFGGGQAEVSIPYTLGPGENPNAVVAYYVDDSGSLQIMRGHYNAKTGMVSFVTTHFSTYMVGYNKVEFSDVADTDWCGDAVSFIAARGITSGTGNGLFNPNASLTRGQFIVMLMRAYGLSPDEAPSDNFADAGATYYTGYLSAAKRMGITQGIGGNRYEPERSISRQEMFTLLYRSLAVLGEVPEKTSGKTLSDFSDAGSIGDYAQEAMRGLVESGVVAGNGGMLNPNAVSSRAEMAQILYNLLSQS